MTAGPRGIGSILLSARSLSEYRAMFDLDDGDLLAGRILDCPGGAGSVAAEVRALGGSMTSVDPAYMAGGAELSSRSHAEVTRGNRYVDRERSRYVWGYFSSVGRHRQMRTAACEAFAADYALRPGHYVAGGLPDLPFPDGCFALVLSAHLLFSYPDHLDFDDHLAALTELVRVAASETRVFPLVDTESVRYPRVDELRGALAGAGIDTEVRPVPYEFQRGGDEMLVCRRAR